MRLRLRTVLFVSLAFLLSALILAARFFYDPNYVTSLLLKQVEQQIGRKIDVGAARLELFPRIRLELTQVVVRDLDPSQAFFRAQRLDLILRAFALLRHQVMGKRLLVERPSLQLHRDRDGRWNFLMGIREKGPGDAMGNPLALLTLVRDTMLTQGELTLIDESRPGGTRSLQIVGLEAAVSVDPQDLHAEIRLSGRIPHPSGESSFRLTGTFTQTPATVRIDPEETTRTMPGVQFEGVAEAVNLNIQQIADFLGPRPASEYVHGSINLNGQISLVPGVVGYDMVLSKMRAEVERLLIKGQASISGLLAPQSTFSLTFSSSPVTLQELLTRFPVQWLHPELRDVVAEREISGTVEVLSATLTGAVDPEPRFSLSGEFKVTHGQMLVGRDRTRAQDISGTVFIEPDRLRVMDLSGTYGPMRVNGGKALVSFLESGPSLDLKVTGEMAAAELIKILARTITYAPVANALGALQEIRGETALALHVAGPVKDPDSLRLTEAEVTARDVWFLSPQLTERVVDLNGRIVFSPGGVEFDRVSGRLGLSQFEVQGLITTAEISAYHDFTIRARVDLARLLKLAMIAVPSNMTVGGMAGLAVAFSGPLPSPRLRGVMELKEGDVELPNFFKKPIGTPASIEFEGEVSRDVLSVERLDLILPPFRMTGKGTVRLRGKYNFEGTFVSGPISLAGLPQGLTLGPAKDGILEVSLDLRGRGQDWKTWQVSGWVALTDGLIAWSGLEDPITDLYLRLKLVRNGAEIKRLAFKLKGSDVRLSGVVRNWNRAPVINLQVESSQLDLDLLIPKGARSPVRDVLEMLAATSQVVVAVNVDHGRYKRFVFTDLSWRVNLINGVLDVDRISGDTEEGHIAGRLIARLPRLQPAELEVSLRVTGVPFERVTSTFGLQERPIVGRMSLSARLQGAEGRHGGILKSLRSIAPIELLIEDGHIQRLTVISKILTILNLPTLLQGKVDLTRDGMPFDTLTARFSIADGVVTVEKIVVDSPVMKISGAGRYNLLTDQLDMAMATSPFGSYSQLLKSIPLFGKLFRGERQGIDTALFEIKGSLNDPQVTYLPMKSLAKGLSGLAELAFDILKNTIMLPKDIIAPDEASPSPPSPDVNGQRQAPAPAAP